MDEIVVLNNSYQGIHLVFNRNVLSRIYKGLDHFNKRIYGLISGVGNVIKQIGFLMDKNNGTYIHYIKHSRKYIPQAIP